MIMPKRGWEIPEREATPEEVFLNRRKFMRSLGLASIGAVAGCSSGNGTGPVDNTGDPVIDESPGDITSLYPATTNPAFAELDRPLTDESVARTYNNFYEFTIKKNVWQNIDAFESRPWTTEVTGLVQNPQRYDVDELTRLMPLEERLYRHRCVEAWSMAFPWTGFQMKALMDLVQPLSSARYVKMTSFLRPDQAQGQWDRPDWPWAYTEALTIEAAANELTFLATGIYGHQLPDQHGAPIRLVVPWKYGFKGIKSIERIEFTQEKPSTFWTEVEPTLYGFNSIVNPNVPNPLLGSQERERFFKKTWDYRPTLLYNGYGDYVAHLYSASDLELLA
jgi:sulfoxide reductase catalytic subunit YedY